MQSKCVVIIVNDTLISFEIENVKLEYMTYGKMGFDKTHVVDYINSSTIIYLIKSNLRNPLCGNAFLNGKTINDIILMTQF